MILLCLSTCFQQKALKYGIASQVISQNTQVAL